MNCPPEIAAILIDILSHALLRIRNMGCSEFTSFEANHIHNLPDLLRDYSLDRLRYYWEYERPGYLSALKRWADNAHVDATFEKLWNQLGPLVEATSKARG